MNRSVISMVLTLLVIFYFSSGLAQDEIDILIPDREAKITHQMIDRSKVLVSVRDAEDKPIRGLTLTDFVIKRGPKKARILSAEPLETSKEIPLNIVLVVDNSVSMRQRRAVKPLLSALQAFFETIRPIDNIHAVVFSTDRPIKVKEYTLNAERFSSTRISKLNEFLNEAFGRGITSGTYLYEAMVAGIDIVRTMPESAQKFLVVFSDGEDINSSVTRTVVESEAVGIPNFEIYTVDYMPGSKEDRFLKSFAEAHGGRLWKARSADELLPIFQSFTTTLLYRYVVSYRILDPPRGTVRMEPAELNFDRLTMIGGAPIMNKVFFETGESEIPEHYVLFTERAQVVTFAPDALRTALDRYYNILNLVGMKMGQNPTVRVRIVGCNSDSGVEENNIDLSRQRAEAVKAYLFRMWNIEPYRMQVAARNLPENPTPMIVAGGRQENQRVEIVFDSAAMQEAAENQFFVETHNRKEIRIIPDIVAEYGIASWILSILADGNVVKTLTGSDDLEPPITLPLETFGRDRLATYRNLKAQIRVTDIYDDTHEAETDPCRIQFSERELIHELVGPLQGSVAMLPEILVIEELTTIDTSPLLNYIFFDAGESEIPSRYVLLTNQTDASAFDEKSLRGTMEKYHHVLNIIGNRLARYPESRITIVGCNSNRGAESGKTELSRGRAEAVRAYLRYVWGIDPSRMAVEARNLPPVPSSGSVPEGRAENQRVEIHSDTPEILDTITSTFVEEISNTERIQIIPQITSGYDIAHWAVELRGDGVPIDTIEGTGDLLPSYTLDVHEIGAARLGTHETLQAIIEVTDKRGQSHRSTGRSSVRFIKREERVAQKMGYKVVEKYALILFDFDSAEIKTRNKAVLDRIVERIRAVPNARVRIVGHTDTIGKEAYNIDLSARRAKAAYDQLLAGGATALSITYRGVGPYEPLYDNSLPEGRALNRTVTVTLEYEAVE